MAIVVDVSLISGKNVSLEAGLDSSVGSLKERARRALGVGKARLFRLSGRFVGEDTTVEPAGLRTGDCLTLQIGKVQIGAHRGIDVSQQYWAMGLSSRGAVLQVVATATRCETS